MYEEYWWYNYPGKDSYGIIILIMTLKDQIV